MIKEDNGANVSLPDFSKLETQHNSLLTFVRDLAAQWKGFPIEAYPKLSQACELEDAYGLGRYEEEQCWAHDAAALLECLGITKEEA